MSNTTITRSYSFLAVAFSLIGAMAPAQEPQKPGSEHARLKEMVGTWDTVMEMGGQKSKGTATYKSICGGMWIASDFESELGGVPFQGHGMDGYDQLKKKYIGHWFDSMSSTPMTMEGNFDADHKVLTMTGSSPGPDGKPQKFRATNEMKGTSQMTFKMFMVSASNGKEELAFTIEYTRRK
jgi:Protein of unknown function (DUF1579)